MLGIDHQNGRYGNGEPGTDPSVFDGERCAAPCAALLEGEYGNQGLFVGVPVKLGRWPRAPEPCRNSSTFSSPKWRKRLPYS
jgi:hypothetical protein